MNVDDLVKQLQSWQVLSRDALLECPPWLSLSRETIRLPDGREINDYYQLDLRDYVEIIAWQNGKALGLWRYKHGPRQVTLGFPAGHLEDGEDALKAARRELREEANLASEHWQLLSSYCIDANRGPARAHFCVAHDCRPIASTPSDDLETHVPEWLTPRQWADHLAGGRVGTLAAAMAIYSGILVPSLAR